MALSQMEKTEIMHRVMGLRDDELKHMLKFIPTAVLLGEISRREGVIVDKLSCVCQVWDDLTINKPFDDMDIMERENLVKQLRRAVYYGEER